MSKILLHLKMLKRGVGDEVYKLQFNMLRQGGAES